MTPFGIRKRLKSLIGGGEPEPAAPPTPRYAVTFELPDGSSYTAPAKHEDSLVLSSGRGPQPISTGCADGTCATCRVVVLAGADKLTPPTDHEAKIKAENDCNPDYRLGCQTLVLGEGVRVRIINVFGEELAEG